MQVGDKVKVKEPFRHSFPSEYTVIEVVQNPDDTTVYILSDNSGGFDAMYLELA